MAVKPALRWAGGKRWLTRIIDEFLPAQINNYYEPFGGGISMLIHLLENDLIQHDSFVSDTNEHLINFYNQVKYRPEEVINNLVPYENTYEQYYTERDQVYNINHQRAAQFLYLNRTNFNGLYRENLKGKYNVPYGNKQYAQLFDFQNLSDLSDLIQGTFFTHLDFEQIEIFLNPGDFVFLDPPYTVMHENNGFVKYNQHIYSWEDQERLRNFLIRINEIGVNFILTNAQHASIVNLYDDLFDLHEMNRASTVGGVGAARGRYNELLISNININ